ncbi:MAG: hypothetical protein AB7Q81_08140 [Gammaproteobacteria bacterium]
MIDQLTTLELAGLVLSAEFALVACVVPALLWRRGRSQTAAERGDAQRMLDGVESAVPTRREALATIFASTYQLEGDDLDARVDEFIAREQAFYEVMTSVYLERDSSRLKEIPEELTKVISPWIRLTPRNAVDRAEVDSLEATNSELSDRNAKLSAELERTRTSMEELMQEYLRAYRKGESVASAAVAVAVAEPATSGDALDADDIEIDFDDAEEPAGDAPAGAGETRRLDVDAVDETPASAPAAPVGAPSAADDVLGADDIDELFAAVAREEDDDMVGAADEAGDGAVAAEGVDLAAADDPAAASADDREIIDVSVDDDDDERPTKPAAGGLSQAEADELAGLFDEELNALDDLDDDQAAA